MTLVSKKCVSFKHSSEFTLKSGSSNTIYLIGEFIIDTPEKLKAKLEMVKATIFCFNLVLICYEIFYHDKK